MGFFSRLFSRPSVANPNPLYDAVVARARSPFWYTAGAVPDTVDGRFDVLAAVLSLVLIRLEREPDAAEPSARLTERFVTDMDGQLREIGIGDIIVGKHIGRMMAALGGRMGAYRDALASGSGLEEALIRNMYRGEAPEIGSVEATAREMRDLAAGLDRLGAEEILAGRLPS
jgi:cytochrome b pre-mRNA-processing protein 3